MAEAMLFDLSARIFESLGSALFKEIGSLFGVKDDLAKLKRTVFGINAKLLDAEERSNRSREVEHWLKELKDVLYEVDDLLDAYSTEILQRNAMSGNILTKEVRSFFSGSNRIAYRVKMSRKIRSVKEKLDAIAKDMSRFNFRDQTSESRVENFQWRETHSYVDANASVIIGREHDKEEVMELLSEVNENENVSTVAVVGLGGLGKTTLAQLVFNDQDFSADFELKIWVYVSEIFDVKTIAQKILETSEKLEMETLQRKLREKIDGKKYLLVLDDLWNDNHEDWLKLETLLKGGARGSRILVTTRSEKVATSTQSFRSYKLKGLNEDDSWSLFRKMVIRGRNESEVSIFQDIGREIMKNCGGVPLTIRSIGGVLYYETTESDWLRVKNGFANVNASIREDLKILKLSYDHLPSHLKQCFAYCFLFPKGYCIEKNNLIQLWIAQGFVQSSGDYQHLEDAGDKYWSELLWRSFFQEAQADFWFIMGFKMHDLMCDLARFVAGTECSISDQVDDEKTRHLSLKPTGSSSVFPNGLLKAKSTRTLILQNQGCIYHGNPTYSDHLDTIFSTFRRLRALDLRCFEFKSLPDSIGELKHLRYLDISYNNRIKKLPRCIGKLQNLQTLKLSYCEYLLELPSEITKIASLRHIEIEGCSSLKHMPHGLGQLTSLRTLSLFVVGNSQSSESRQGAGLCELKKLNNLRGNLVILGLENATIASNDDHYYLKEKQSLHSLSLYWKDDEKVDDSDKLLKALEPHPSLKEVWFGEFGGLKIPNWISSLRNVVSIGLSSCRRCQHIPKLDHLPCLKRLSLEELPALEYISSEISDFGATFFPSLERLELRDCKNLRGWWRAIDVEIPQFQRLSWLEVNNCPKLTSMPLFPFLKYLRLSNASPKPLQETVEMLENNMAATPSRMSSFHFSGVEDLKSHLEQWLQCFPSLDTLSISDCPGLTLLPPHLKHLCSLQCLDIVNAKDLDPSSDDNGEDFQWQHLTSLRDLTLEGLRKMVALPSALQHVTTLQSLSISSCPTLKALPEWLPNLNALHSLWLSDCPQLKSMPDGMPRLTSLRKLHIYNCGELSKRCQKNEGEDWPKIAHVVKFDLL